MEEHDQQGRTDRLASLLEFALSSKHTGICNVERGKGGVRQFGKLIFLDGELVDAIADTRTGFAAWEWLKTWSYCQYTFIIQHREEIKIPPQVTTSSAIPSPTPIPTPLSLLSQMFERVTHSLTDSLAPTSSASEDASSGELVQENLLWSEPMTEPPHMPSDSPLTPIPYSRSSTNEISLYDINRASSMNGIGGNGYPQSTNYAANQWNNLFLQQAPAPISLPSPVPLRLIDGDDSLRLIEKYRLPRQHRHIFFLLNGQRSADDIVRLTKRPLNEIQQVLEDLKQCGLIKL